MVTLGPAADGFTPRKNAVKQAAVIEALRRGDLRMAELAVEFGAVCLLRCARSSRKTSCTSSADAACGARGPRSTRTGRFPLRRRSPSLPRAIKALSVIGACVERGRGEVVLVDGVTARVKPRCTCRRSRMCWREVATPSCSSPRSRSPLRPSLVFAVASAIRSRSCIRA